jgi:4-amino-4-deoxy-L-arabinose transferase-like glycosyltransferase
VVLLFSVRRRWACRLTRKETRSGVGERRRSQKEPYLAVVLLLLLLFVLLTFGSQRFPMTADEPAYIAFGYGLLSQGDGVFPLLTQRGYPPLLIGLEASLVYLADPAIPVQQMSGWPTAYSPFLEAFKPHLAPETRTKTAARMPIVLLAVILGAVVYRWGRDLWGARAGLLALGVLLFDPLLLAHGRLANSDAGTVALGTAALYVTWRWAGRPSWRRALGMGTLLGLTMLAKVSGILWVGAAGLVVAGSLIRKRPERQGAEIQLQGVVALGFSLFVLWAGYGFDWGPVRHFPISMPVPAHWENLLYLDEYGGLFFALGRWGASGWWWYFPVAFLIKNPLPLLIGLAIGLAVLVRRRSLSTGSLLALGIFPLLYAAAAIYEGLDIGYRFMLPIHPFLYLLIGGGVAGLAWGSRGRTRWRWALTVLGAWYLFGTLRMFPYEISFFNELIGGPEEGYRYLSDSSVDWGQSADLLDAYLKAHPDAIDDPPVQRFRPSPGRYVVSASYLQGVGVGARNAYAWFRQRKPQDIIEYSLLVYDVPPLELHWFAQCVKPAVPLDWPSVVAGTGRDDLRDIRFDCTQAWVYPDGGATAGIYALHHDLVWEQSLCLPHFLPCLPSPRDAFVARHVEQARLSYEQAYDGRLPAFLLYEMASVPVAPSLAEVRVGSLETLPDAGQAPQRSDGSVALDGPLAFLGLTAFDGKDGLEVETWWRVTGGPITRPFSIMAHLVSSKGEVVEVADGLGVSPVALTTGDVLVQRHHFSEVGQDPGVYLVTGAYWRDTMERWRVVDSPDGDVILMPLEAER